MRLFFAFIFFSFFFTTTREEVLYSSRVLTPELKKEKKKEGEVSLMSSRGLMRALVKRFDSSSSFAVLSRALPPLFCEEQPKIFLSSLLRRDARVSSSSYSTLEIFLPLLLWEAERSRERKRELFFVLMSSRTTNERSVVF